MSCKHLLRPLALAALLVAFSAVSFAGVFLSVSVGPPPLPVYSQPMCPGPGYIWTPGYWGWGDEGYYWVPGTWVMPPEAGLYWTPGYWGWNEGSYMWNAGYWGPQVGFYGGIDYGFGYPGSGFYGGEWRGHDFYYNRAVDNVNVTNIHNVYNRTVVINNRSRVSYNGGQGGINMRPTAQQEQWRNQRHVEATSMQQQHVQEAARNPKLWARNNNGRPAIAATARPNDFQHAVAARAAGGHINRAALTATPKNMPAARNANTRAAERNSAPARNARNEATPTRGAERNVPRPANATASRPANRTESAHSVPKPPSATSNRTAETRREPAAAPARHEPAPPARAENTPHSPKPSPAESHRASAPRPTRPEASAASHEPAGPRNSRQMSMPEAEHAPASHPAPHEASRPAPQAHAEAPHRSAEPSHAAAPSKSEPRSGHEPPK